MNEKKPQGTGDQRMRVTRYDLHKGLELETGKTYQITVSDSGYLAAVLLTEDGSRPLGFRHYSVSGGRIRAAGLTDAGGRLQHRGIPHGTYRLEVEDATLEIETVRDPARARRLPVPGIKA
jgi:hypothetical protein